MGDAKPCSVPDCPKPAEKRGWCGMHYTRQRRTGTTECDSPRIRRTATICAVDGCPKPRSRRNWCSMHDARERLTGTTDAKPKPTLSERFWSRVDKNGPSPEYRPDLGPCWLWTGAVSAGRNGQKGYGVFTDEKCRRSGAHACSYIISGRVIPKGYEVDHLCMVKLCVNPSHLEAVTQAENRRRADVAYGIRAAQTHCKHRHEYTPENTLWVDGGKHRACRTCTKARDAARWAARKAARA